MYNLGIVILLFGGLFKFSPVSGDQLNNLFIVIGAVFSIVGLITEKK